MEKISFLTSDGIKIIANWSEVGDARGATLLLHMMPATKKSWSNFSQKLNDAGFSTLAIDLRGHGESNEDGELDYNDFTDHEHQKYRLDVEAALKFLKVKGVMLDKIDLIGASIGANLVIDFIAKYKEIKKGIMLSPGLDYKGVVTVPAVSKMESSQALYLVATKDDQRSGGSADKMAEQIFEAAKSKKEIKIFETGGHGTTILESHPEFIDELIKWL